MKRVQGTTTLAVGEVMSSNSYGDFEIIEADHSRKIKIRFLDTGCEKTGRASDLIKGEVSDPMRPFVATVGYPGIGHHKRRGADGKHTAAYSTWKNMLRRCYVESERWYHKYGGRGVTVCEEWHNFQNFAEWYNERYREGYQLDKDLLSKSSKIYSPSTCVLIPQKVNILVSPIKRRSSDYPRGVVLNTSIRRDTAGRKFKAVFGENYKMTTLGYFDSMHDAFMAYKNAKEDYIKRVAEEEFSKQTISQEVYDALMAWQVYPY